MYEYDNLTQRDDFFFSLFFTNLIYKNFSSVPGIFLSVTQGNPLWGSSKHHQFAFGIRHVYRHTHVYTPAYLYIYIYMCGRQLKVITI